MYYARTILLIVLLSKLAQCSIPGKGEGNWGEGTFESPFGYFVKFPDGSGFSIERGQESVSSNNELEGMRYETTEFRQFQREIFSESTPIGLVTKIRTGRKFTSKSTIITHANPLPNGDHYTHEVYEVNDSRAVVLPGNISDVWTWVAYDLKVDGWAEERVVNGDLRKDSFFKASTQTTDTKNMNPNHENLTILEHETFSFRGTHVPFETNQWQIEFEYKMPSDPISQMFFIPDAGEYGTFEHPEFDNIISRVPGISSFGATHVWLHAVSNVNLLMTVSKDLRTSFQHNGPPVWDINFIKEFVIVSFA